MRLEDAPPFGVGHHLISFILPLPGPEKDEITFFARIGGIIIKDKDDERLGAPIEWWSQNLDKLDWCSPLMRIMDLVTLGHLVGSAMHGIVQAQAGLELRKREIEGKQGGMTVAEVPASFADAFRNMNLDPEKRDAEDTREADSPDK